MKTPSEKGFTHTQLKRQWFPLINRGNFQDIKDFKHAHPDFSIEATTDGNRTALLIAASKGDSSLLKWLIEEMGANVHVADTSGDTLLHHVARANSKIALNLGLAQLHRGLDINAQNHLLHTPFLNEIQARSDRARIELWLSHGADASLPYNQPIGLLCARDSDDLLPILVEHGAQINPLIPEKSRHGWRIAQPLHDAAKNGALRSTQWLLDHGARVDTVDPYGHGVLANIASCRTSPSILEVMRLLIEAGADPLTQGLDGKIALDLANETHAPEAYRLLENETQRARLNASTPANQQRLPGVRL